MACDDRQLSQAQRAAAFAQQRTGVVRAVRPFSGSATVENLVDYINRELGPAVRASRDAINECFLQVADNAPSANPLAFYFSESTAAADPTVGRIRLNASPQNTATVMRVSQSNARLVDVQPWLDVMAGGPTTPLGVVTLVDAINPARFIRWDLNTMTDQGAYWDLGITVIESSNDDPFVEDEAVVIGFISGVSAAGSTIPVGALTPIAADTFVGNITTGVAAPVAVPLASVDSASIIYDATTHTFQRAALTGAVVATQNSNATLFAGIRDNGSAETDRTSLNFLSTTSVVAVVTDDAGSDELEITAQRAALTGFAEAAQNSNATTSAEPIVTYSASANMSNERVATSSTSVTVSTSVASQIEFQRAALTGEVTAAANANATTVVRSTNFQAAPWTGNHQFEGAVVGFGVLTHTTLGATTSNLTIGAVNCVRIDPSGISDTLTGMVASFDGQWVWLENVDSTVGFTIVHDATSTAANRFYCPVTQDFFLPARVGLWCRYDGTLQRWILSDTKQWQGMTVVDVSGAVNASGFSTLAFNAGLNTTWGIVSSLTAPFSRADITLNVSASPTFDAVLINEQTTSATSVPAGDGMFWVRGDVPNVPMFTDDSNADHPLLPGYSPQLSATIVTAATTTLGTTGTRTIPANTLVAGSRFRIEYTHRFVRGATATALNLNCYLDLNASAALTATVTGAATAAGTYYLRTVTEFTVLTTGASGIAMGVITTWGNAFAGGAFGFAAADDVVISIDTTVSNTVRGAADMSGAVASTSIRATGGHVDQPC